MTETSNYYVWKQLINAISLSNSRCESKTTQIIIQDIMDDMNDKSKSDFNNPFFKCKIEQMLFLFKSLSFLDESNKRPLQNGIEELCKICQQHIKENIN